MNRQEFEDTSRRYREEMFRMYANQSIVPKPKPPQKPLPKPPQQPPATPPCDCPPQPPAGGLLPLPFPLPVKPVRPMPPPPQPILPPMPRSMPQESESDVPDATVFAVAPEPPEEAYTGTIRVHVSTGQGARPIIGATVTISRIEQGISHLVSVQQTNESGNILPVTVPAPPPSADQRQPDYYIYDLSVQSGGYYREHSTDVPVFPHVTSVQNFDLIPLPAGHADPSVEPPRTFYNNTPKP